MAEKSPLINGLLASIYEPHIDFALQLPPGMGWSAPPAGTLLPLKRFWPINASTVLDHPGDEYPPIGALAYAYQPHAPARADGTYPMVRHTFFYDHLHTTAVHWGTFGTGGLLAWLETRRGGPLFVLPDDLYCEYDDDTPSRTYSWIGWRLTESIVI